MILSLMDMYLLLAALGQYALDICRSIAETKRLILNPQNKKKKWEEKTGWEGGRSWECHQKEGSGWWILWFVFLAYPEEWDPSPGSLTDFMSLGANQFLSPTAISSSVVWKIKNIYNL